MAADDKLSFDISVRDNVTKLLEALIGKSTQLEKSLAAASEEVENLGKFSDAYKNAAELEQVIYKIEGSIKRVADAQSRASDGSVKDLGAVRSKLEDMLGVFTTLKNQLNEKPAGFFEKDMVAVTELMEGMKLAIEQADQYVRSAEKVTAANDKMFEKAIQDLNAFNEQWEKMNHGETRQEELIREMREQLQLEKQIAEENEKSQSKFNFDSWENAEKERWHTRARESAAVFQKEFENEEKVNQILRERQEMEAHRKEREQLKDDAEVKAITDQINRELSAREKLNRMVDQNKASYAALEKVKLDAESQQRIANIRGQNAEIAALRNKIVAIADLMSRVRSEQLALENGAIKTPTLTRDVVTKELEAIQRQYNEDLAQGKVREEAAEKARKKLAQATERAAKSTGDYSQANRGLMNTFKELERAGKSTNRMIDQMTQSFATMFSFYGMKRLVQEIVTIGGQFEFQHVALQNILGDIQEANTLFTQLQDLAVESPKTFMELTSYAKQLSAYQIPANELYDTTKRLADMSTGLGVDMGRLILAYGQVRSAAVLRGQELRQFTEAGIPLVQKLADKFTEMNGKLTTTADVFALISKRKVPFEMVQEVLWDMTNQGGQFYNMQSELADTLYGKWQKLQDTWQIMLGHIADGNSIMGALIKNTLEGIVAITRSMDVLMPMIAMLGVGRLARGVKNLMVTNYENLYNKTDSGAIATMKLAKEKEANRLMRERYQMGRMLTAQEWELIRTKSQATLNDKLQLAYEGRISDKMVARAMMQERLLYDQERQNLLMNRYTQEEARQILLDKERNILMSYRLLLMKGYTKEQIRQMQAGNMSAAQGGLTVFGQALGKLKSGFMSLIGGVPGLILTIAGGLLSVKSYFDQKAEELEQKGDAMMSHAQQNANNLKKTLNATDTETSMEKKIEALEEALINIGATGEAVVAKSREHMDDINKRWETLKAGAEDYQKTLESLGNQKGKALFQEAIDDSDIEDRLKDYDAAVNDVFKQYSKLNKFSETYKEFIATLTNGNKKLAKQLEGKTLFEQIDTVGTENLINKMDEKIKKLQKNSTERIYLLQAQASLRMHLDLLNDVDEKWEKITKKSIPAMKDELEAMAKNIGIESFDALKPEQKQSLETLTREYVNSISEGSKEAKDKLAQELASQVFHIKIVGDLSIDKTQLSSFASYVWAKFGGNSKLNQKLGSKGNVKIGNSVFSKAQVANVFADIDQYDKDTSDEINKLRKTLKLQKQLGDAADLVSDTEKKINDKLAERRAVGLDDPKEKGSKGGSKKDTQLERAKTRLDEIKKFYAEYKKYRDVYGAEKGQSLVEEIFGMAPGAGDRIVKNYKETLKSVLNTLNINTEERKKFATSIKQLIGEIDLDAVREQAKKVLDVVKDEIQRQSSQWNLYKSLLEKTGSNEFAMSAFADGKLWDDQAKALAESLEQRMKESVVGNGEVRVDWDADEKAAEEYFKKNFENGEALFELWKEIVKLLRGNYTESLNDIADSTKNIMTLDMQILAIEREIEELRRKGVSDNDPRILAKQKDLDQKKNEQFESSDSYIRFFNGITTMTLKDAEKIGAAIKKNLSDKLIQGKINADKYAKSIQNVDKQIEKLRNKKSTFELVKSGGILAFYEDRYNSAQENENTAAQRVQDAEDKLTAARIASANTVTDAEIAATQQAEERAMADKAAADEEYKAAKTESDNARTQYVNAQKFNKTLSTIGVILEALSDFWNDALKMAEELEGEMEIDGWAEDLMNSIGRVSNGIKKFQSGDIAGGLMEGVFGVISSIVNGHDKRLAKDQERSEKRVKALEELDKQMERALDRILGGIYNVAATSEQLVALKNIYEEINPRHYGSRNRYEGVYQEDTQDAVKKAYRTKSYYDVEYASMLAKRDELKHQVELEEDKKKKDQDKISDLKSEIIELEEEIEGFAEDMAKALYDIDIKSWASDLGDALFEAWQKGEDGAEAFKKKASEIIADLSKKIAITKLIETAMEPVLDVVKNEMKRTEGKLDEQSVENIAAAMSLVGSTVPTAFNNLMDGINEGVKRAGLEDLKTLGSDSSSSSSKNTIQSVTEQTADLIASYINAIRADVSVNRGTLSQILIEVQAQSDMPVIARAQLEELRQIVDNTSRNADAADRIYDLLHSVSPDGTSIRIR